MPDFEFRYLLLAALAIALLVAAFTDIRRRQIDNWLNGAIAASAPLYWWASGLSLWPGVAWQLGVAVVTLVVLAGLFAMRAMGGGDVKLLTALALWIEPLWFMRLLIGMALIGGVLTIVLGMWHVIRKRRDKLAVPYGVAISSAGLWVLAAQFLPAFQSAATAQGAG
ncbi:prepilin peptidase [Novosphingobium sp.]|uniref:A24 family peptidase n=1 Tax=Novosphingobium sp. TaxID=1874826 RepID=UPI0025E3AB0A|nr:prepilin peptidase [Novosphingobium sp.]MCC6925044.1 prepilin peptidase [Novosphingobium sp.]